MLKLMSEFSPGQNVTPFHRQRSGGPGSRSHKVGDGTAHHGKDIDWSLQPAPPPEGQCRNWARGGARAQVVMVTAPEIPCIFCLLCSHRPQPPIRAAALDWPSRSGGAERPHEPRLAPEIGGTNPCGPGTRAKCVAPLAREACD